MREKLWNLHSPPPHSTSSRNKKDSRESDSEDSEDRAEHLMFILTLSIKLSLLAVLTDYHKPKQLWKFFMKLFENAGDSHKYDLKNRLQLIEFSEHLGTEYYFAQFCLQIGQVWSKAGCAWFEKINHFLDIHNFSRTEADYSLYFILDSNEITILILYVDDLLITGSNTSGITWIKEQPMRRFKMSDLGHINFYLSVESICTPARILLLQKAYTSQILKEFSMEGCTPSSTPMTEGFNLNREQVSSEVDAKLFQKLVGILIYLVNTRLEIPFATVVLSRFMHDPRVPHRQAANHVLQYTKGTIVLRIFYER